MSLTDSRKEIVAMDNGYLTVEEVAKMMNVSRSWVYNKVKAGSIPHVRIGSMIRFAESDIMGWIEEHKVAPK